MVLLAGIGSILLSGPAAGQDVALSERSGREPGAPEMAERRTLRSVRLEPDQRVRLDGRLDEAVWAEVPVATDFVQREPEPGQPASERTEVAVLYDAAALYVGFRCFVRDPATLVARLARRDEFVTSDRVLVELDSYDDDRTAFSFSVTAGGVERDVLIYNDGDEDDTWNAVWEGESARFSGAEGAGYTAEFRIPFSQLRYASGHGPQTWGVQFQRDIPATGESAFWAPILPDVEGYVSRFGTLEGLDIRRAPRQVEILPYAAARLIRASGDPGDPFYSPNEAEPAAGFDAKVGLASNLTLTATVNPDFGQVEADPAVVNLSAFETFFPERRPFFVEGVDIFDFGATRTSNVSYRPAFFYSRRVGRQPTRLPEGAVYLDSPEQTTIAAAAKVSGKVGPWSIGILDAVTLEEQARYLTETGGELVTPVEPLSNYFVGRVRRDFREGASALGGLLTATSRRMGADSLFTGLLAEDAYVGGLDFEHRFEERRWTVSGVVAGSAVSGDPERITALQRAPQRYFQRPDQDYLAFDPAGRSLLGVYSELSLAKTGGRHWRGSLTGNVVTPGFEVNDLGFQSRADAAALDWYVEYNEPQPRALNYYSFYAFGGGASNFGGDLIDHYYRAGTFLRFANLWTLSTTAGLDPVHANDRLTRGGPLASRAPVTALSSALSTDRGRRLSASFRADFRHDLPHRFEGTVLEWDRYFTLGLTARPSDALELSLEPTWGVQVDTDQYLRRIADPAAAETFGARYVFADIRQEEVNLALRLNWTFTPELTLQLYAQPFILSGRYSRFKQFRTPGSFDFDVYGESRGTITPQVCEIEPVCEPHPPAPGQAPDSYLVDPGAGGEPFTLSNPDFNFRSLRGNAVLRWEWRPGSTLFLVWQQLRNDFAPYDGFGVVEELGEVFRAPVENVFLAKLTYWFGL